MNLFEKDEEKQIKRNIDFILSTYQYSCPMFRGFGIAGAFIDKTNLQAQGIARSEIIEAISKYEPRAEIDEIDFEFIEDRLIPIVKIKKET